MIEPALLVLAAPFPIVSPIAGAPLFLAMTDRASGDMRAALARRIALHSLVLVVNSTLVRGTAIELFGLSVPVIPIAGGVPFTSVAWDLLHAEPSSSRPPARRALSGCELAARALDPMTPPPMVGPGSLPVAITLAACASSGWRHFALMVAPGRLGARLARADDRVPVAKRRSPDAMPRRDGAGPAIRLHLLCSGVPTLRNGASAPLGTVPAIRPQ